MAFWPYKMRWFEPVGQIFVLIAIALQLFVLVPAQTSRNEDRIQSIQDTVLCVGNKIGMRYPCDDENHFRSLPRLQAYIELDQAIKRREEIEGGLSKGWYYIALFLFGGALSVIGKMASIAASKK